MHNWDGLICLTLSFVVRPFQLEHWNSPVLVLWFWWSIGILLGQESGDEIWGEILIVAFGVLELDGMCAGKAKIQEK